MDPKTLRILFIELVGAFGLVFFSAGLVCINVTTQPEGSPSAPLAWHQPGAFGIALGQGLILAALLALTVPVTGGYLNPAITLMLWVFTKVETPRAAGLIVVQLVGGVLAALALRCTFVDAILKAAHFGAPHVNPLPYPVVGPSAHLTGAGVEVVLTFFLVFAIFGIVGVGAISSDPLRLGLISGMIATACVLFGFPLTGAAMNPARWLGPALLDAVSANTPRNPWGDSLVYLAGPILGALLGGYFVFKVYQTPPEKK
jgi:aquaporin Z